MIRSNSAPTFPGHPAPARRAGLRGHLWRGADLALVAALLLAGAALLGPFGAAADLLCQFLLQGAVLAAALGLAFLLGRRPRRALLAAAALATQLWQIQPGGFPPAVAGTPGLRVLSLNLYIHNPTPAALVDWLVRSDADVLALQEAYPPWPAHLAALTRHYPHRLDCFAHAGCDLVLLSRHPWQQGKGVVDPRTGAPLVAGEIATTQGPLRIATTHLSRPVLKSSLAEQLTQIDFLARKLGDSAALPTLFVGDFNGVPWGQAVGAFERATALRALRGLEGTWPARLPWPFRLPIDQALAGPDLPVTARAVVRAPGSDHRAVLLTLGGRLPAPAQPDR